MRLQILLMSNLKLLKEQWCPACDCSSRENAGRFAITVWYCNKCLEEMGLFLNKHVSKEDANKVFKAMREVLNEQ